MVWIVAWDPEDEVVLTVDLTPNQVVAYNLLRARQWRSWTQRQAIEALEPHLGTRWSVATYSAAERSVDGARIRQFTADDLVAFSRAFDLPLTWFFLPPEPSIEGRPVRLDTPDQTGIAREPIGTLIDVVFGASGSWSSIGLRLATYFDQVGEHGPMTGAQDAVRRTVTQVNAAVARQGLRRVKGWETALRSIANQLEDLGDLARSGAAEAIDVPETEL